MAYYVDTSALVKLVVAEAETDTLRAWIDQAGSPLVSSDLTRAELLRAVRRAASERVVQARTVLDSITLIAVTTMTFESAGRLDPTILRTLDALHIASSPTTTVSPTPHRPTASPSWRRPDHPTAPLRRSQPVTIGGNAHRLAQHPRVMMTGRVDAAVATT